MVGSEMDRKDLEKCLPLYLFCLSVVLMGFSFTSIGISSLPPPSHVLINRQNRIWYDENTIYHIFPKSFKDSTNYQQNTDDGSGIGDLRGIISKLSYFEDIGVKTLYISSLYKSGGQDNGMDVVNHTDIDPIFGTMQDFDELRKETKNKNMRLILDLIPNHTSKKHPWFEKSRRKKAPYTDYYIWAPCAFFTKPNNWRSLYGGSAWEYDPVRGECYYHHFFKEEPDLNLRNPKVKKEIKKILVFWLDKGVDGFNIIGAESLIESKDTTDNENESGLPVIKDDYRFFDTSYTCHLPESIELISKWRRIVDTYSAPGKERMIMLAANGIINQIKSYYGTPESKGANFVITSPVDLSNTKLENVKSKIQEYTSAGSPQWAWSFGNQDQSRLATRVGNEKVKAMLAIQMLLPGVPINYYGNELGMTDAKVLFDDKKDILTQQVEEVDYNQNLTRDPYRTPMQWTSGINAGFSVYNPWLPVNKDPNAVNVESAEALFSGSPLYTLKHLTRLREKESFQSGTIAIGSVGEILWFKRNTDGFPKFVVVINLGATGQLLNMSDLVTVPSGLKLLFHSNQYYFKTGFEHLNFEEKPIFIDSYEFLVFQY